MKKLITGILATLTCLCCFTGCGLLGTNSSSSSVETVATIDEAAAYLDSMYKDHDTKYTDKDYEVVSSVTMEGVTYTVEWAVDVEENLVKVVVGENGKVTIDVNNLLEEDAAYKLTATLTAPDGTTTKTVEFNRTVKANPIVPVAITKKPEEETAYKLYMYQVTTKKDEYFNGTLSKNKFYLNTSLTHTYAVDVFVDYVQDSETDFNVYFYDEDDVKQYIGIYSSYNATEGSAKGYHLTTTISPEINQFQHVLNDATVWNAEKNEFFAGSYVFTWNAEYETIVTTLENAKYDEDKDKAPTEVAAETVTAFMGTSGTYYTFGGMSLEEIENEDTCVGKLVEMLDKRTVEPEQKVEDEKMFLKTEMTFSGDVEETLPTASRYNDVTITWAVKEGDAEITDGVLTVAAPDVEATVTLTATIKCGEVTDTLDVTVTVFAIPEEITYARANEIAATLDASKQNDSTTKKYYLTGTVVEVANTTYGNLYIADEEGNTFYVYGVYDGKNDDNYGKGNRYDKMGENAPVVGDEVKFLSVIATYYGSAQLSNATLVEKTSETSNSGKAIIEARKLSVKNVTESGNVTVPVVGTTYTDVTIAWTSNNTAVAAVNGSTITFTVGDTAVDVTLTAKVTCGTFSKDYTFIVKVAKPAAEQFYFSAVKDTTTYYASYTADKNFFTVTTDKTQACKIELQKVENSENDYYIYVVDAESYIGRNSTKNQLSFSKTNKTVWTFNATDKQITTNYTGKNNPGTNYLTFNTNSGQERFSAYANTNFPCVWYEAV